jgi:hypothetical protein
MKNGGRPGTSIIGAGLERRLAIVNAPSIGVPLSSVTVPIRPVWASATTAHPKKNRWDLFHVLDSVNSR